MAAPIHREEFQAPDGAVLVAERRNEGIYLLRGGTVLAGPIAEALARPRVAVPAAGPYGEVGISLGYSGEFQLDIDREPLPHVGMGPSAGGAGVAKRGVSRLLIGVAVFAVLAGIGAIGMIGKSRTGDLQVGDCFAGLGTGAIGAEVRTVDNQSCDEVHTSEVLAIVEAPPWMSYPSPVLGGGEVGSLCQVAIADLFADGELDPSRFTNPDIMIEFLHPAQNDWNRGERSVTCIASSPSGLPPR